MAKKRRTRQHVIAEMSANHLERQALLKGCSVERIEHDYGIDLVLYTYNQNGEIENGQVFVQLKATDDLTVLNDGTITYPVKHSDLELWLREPMPVMLAMYDATNDVAYWQYVQAYYEAQPEFDIAAVGITQSIHIPRQNLVDESAIDSFIRYRDEVLKQLDGVIRHRA